MSFITGKHIPRRTFLRGVGATVALPFLDAMVPAGRVFAKTPRGRADSVDLHRGSARARRLQQLGGDQVSSLRRSRPGPNFTLVPGQPAERARSAPRSHDHHQQHRLSQRGSVRAAGDRRRPLPLDRRVPDPVASRSRRRAPTSGPAPRWIRSTRRSSARARRCPRCSSASRTSTRPGAAPTTTRAPIPTRSAGRRRTSRCR